MKNKFPIIPMMKILLLCYIITAVLLSILAFLLLKFKIADEQLTLFAYGIYMIVCFVGGFLAGKQSSQKKFLWGLLEGILYFSILLGISFLIQKEMVQSVPHMLIALGLCSVSGMVGGMVS
ncbi:MAG: TIGR04086 family membrane protein [Lachnospiraceae bacterium]